MKCNSIVKTILFVIILDAFFSSRLMAQKDNVAKNFPGIFGGIEWNTTSGSWGIEYERFVYTKNKAAIGVKAAYVARYDYGNLQILSSTCCESVSQIIMMGTGSYYPGQRMNLAGFFIHTGLGAGIERLKYKSQDYSNEKTIFRPAFEFGPGWQFTFANSLALRGKATATFGPFKGAFTSTTVAFGF